MSLINNRNNDAYATIRGFVYQVELTILKWIKLKDNQIMFLECGEDIDVVSRYSSQTDINDNTLLIQVKDYQSSNITLNTVSARKALLDLVVG